MITLREVHKSFGHQTLFDGATLQINQGDRFALVGPNGAGKSTLFKMLLGELEPDGGEIQWRRGVSVGYLPQENPPTSNETILSEALAHHADPDGRLEAKAKAILMGLGFKTTDFERPVSALSGGWAMRVAMAKLLLQEPDLLLLDEPTNHLDMDSLFWFQDYLTRYRGSVFLISHDRHFINTVCSAIVSVQQHILKVYPGDYETFLRERQEEAARIEAAYKQQQAEIADMEEFIMRNRARASTAGRAQSMIKRLEKLERVQLPEETKTVKIRFPQPERAGVRVMQLKNLYKSYGDVKVYQGLDFELERGWKMAFVGHNGAGKSTLLKVLAGVIPFDSGERVLGHNVKVGYFSQHRAEMLDPNKTVLQEAMDNGRLNPDLMVRTVLGTFLFPGDSVFKKTAVLSGGEKSRLALVKLLLDPPNVLLMDEPTTHLDMASVEALLGALKEYEGTICCISHDLYFLNSLAEHVVHVEHGKVTVFPGNYEYFQHRQRQLAEENGVSQQRPTLAAAPEKAAASKGVNPKEDRRRRALERDRASLTVRLQREIAEVSGRIETLTASLQDPALHADFEKVRGIGAELQSLQEILQAKQSELARIG